MLRIRRPRLCTICTAVAPEAVFARRTKIPTGQGYPGFLVTTLTDQTAGHRLAPPQNPAEVANSGRTAQRVLEQRPPIARSGRASADPRESRA